MDTEDGLEDSENWSGPSKFTPSKPNIDLVERPRLIERLNEAKQGKAAFLVAPAGFGKSTVLSQWYEAHSRTGDLFCWLNLDEADREASQFLSWVTLAIAEAGGELGKFEAAARNGFPDSQPRIVLDSLLKRISQFDRDCVLILDDAHRIASPETDLLLEQMARYAPRNFTLVVNSRTGPPVDMPMLVASGDVVEIGAEQLRLTREEAVRALGDTISQAAASEIFELTEGWPVAVQLARVQKKASPDAAMARGISSGLIASYLTHQVLNTLSEDVRRFLLDLSTLEQFNVPLANAVTNSTDSLVKLRELEPLQALIISTDPAGGWMRLHHLFAEHLLDTLRAEVPGRENELYREASKWMSEEGDLIASVKYASLAGDDAMVERLILDAGGWSIILTEGIGVMRTLLRFAREHLVSSSARLLLARAYLCCKDGAYKEARGLFDASQGLRAAEELESYDRDSRLVASMINAYEDGREWTAQIVGMKIEEELENWSPLEAGTLLCETVMALVSAGKLERANHNLELAFGQMRRSGSLLGLNYCYIHAATLALYAARFDLARANIAQSLELAENNFGSDSGLKHLSQVLDFAVRTWTGEARREDIEVFSRALLYVENNDGWAEVYLVGLDGFLAMCEQYNELSLGAEICERILQVAKERGLARVERHCMIVRMRLAQLRGHTNEARTLAGNLSSWLASHDLETEVRDWQNHLLGVAFLVNDRLTANSRNIASLGACQNDAENRGARFFTIRLLVSEANIQRQMGKRDKGIEALTQALSLAASQRVIGPFLGGDRLEQDLAEIKSSLSLRQESLTLMNFVADILNLRRQMRPHTGNELLSPREQEIIEQLAQGRSNKEIARRFELTENTVKFHLKNIYNKLSVHRRTQAIAAARREKLID